MFGVQDKHIAGECVLLLIGWKRRSSRNCFSNEANGFLERQHCDEPTHQDNWSDDSFWRNTDGLTTIKRD